MTDVVRRIFLDTNVLVYRFDSHDPAKQATAHQILNEMGRDRLVLSTQVLQELYVTLTRKNKLGLAADEALSIVRSFCRFQIVQISPDLIQSGIELSRDHQISFWDALILCAAVKGGCEQVLTEDLHHGFRWQGLEIVNPFLRN